MKALFEGLRMVLTMPGLRRNFWQPVLATCGLYLVLLIAGIVTAMSLGAVIIERFNLPDWMGFLGGGVVFAVAWVYASSAIFVGIAGIIAGLFAERITTAIEAARGGEPLSFSHTRAAQAADTAARIGQALVAAVVMAVAGLTPLGPVAAISLGGWLAAMEFTSSAESRRGRLLTDQALAFRRVPGGVGFMIGCGILSMLPVINALALPGMIAGGAILIQDADRAGAFALPSEEPTQAT